MYDLLYDICSFLYGLFLLATIFSHDWLSFSIQISCFCFLCFYWSLNFLLWIYWNSLYWGVPHFHSIDILVYFHLLYTKSLPICTHISLKTQRYPWIGFLRKGIFHIILNYLFLVMCSFGHIFPRACHKCFWWQVYWNYHWVRLLDFLWCSCMLQVRRPKLTGSLPQNICCGSSAW